LNHLEKEIVYSFTDQLPGLSLDASDPSLATFCEYSSSDRISLSLSVLRPAVTDNNDNGIQ